MDLAKGSVLSEVRRGEGRGGGDCEFQVLIFETKQNKAGAKVLGIRSTCDDRAEAQGS